MSKLSDAIHRIARAEAPQIGFSPEPQKARPTMLLAALINGSAKAAGADMVLSRGGSARSKDGAQKEQLRGLWQKEGGDAAAARDQGFDFIVFSGDDAPAAVLLEEETGLVMQAQTDMSDSLLQAMQWMPLDALLVRWDGPVTVRRQLELQRLSGFSRKPLFLFVENELQAPELEVLREAGVIGVVVDLARGGESALKSLRERIDNLRPRPRRSRADQSIISIVQPVVAMAPEPDEPGEDEPE